MWVIGRGFAAERSTLNAQHVQGLGPLLSVERYMSRVERSRLTGNRRSETDATYISKSATNRWWSLAGVGTTSCPMQRNGAL